MEAIMEKLCLHDDLTCIHDPHRFESYIKKHNEIFSKEGHYLHFIEWNDSLTWEKYINLIKEASNHPLWKFQYKRGILGPIEMQVKWVANKLNINISYKEIRELFKEIQDAM